MLGLVKPYVNRRCQANAISSVQLNCRGYQSIGTSIIGSVPEKPRRPRLSLTKVLICVGFGVFVGQLVAKRFAAFMEETELFVPDDDDD